MSTVMVLPPGRQTPAGLLALHLKVQHVLRRHTAGTVMHCAHPSRQNEDNSTVRLTEELEGQPQYGLVRFRAECD